MSKRHFLYLLFAVLLSATTAWAQTTTPARADVVKGRVLDAGGEALIGAQICWKGTKIMTVTDINGEFSIRRDAASPVLVVSYIGYKSKETKVGKDQTNTGGCLSSGAY
ncbi:carboxypeptidase-like regulatory domain-containing protein [Segatella buccae]|uniref:carboxypeptidase-like regulatory domain-containing protein n=1 Tax=Segatella buccae TaxID=28126 RepID=UPI0027B9CE66|nr:carboxypeptidase-like regulatory domain-containing protein [Segatella buccae]